MKQFLLGLLAGGGVAFATGFLKAGGESAWRLLSRKTTDQVLVLKGKKAERAIKRADAQAARDLAAERVRLASDRVGVRFRKRYTRDDTGTILRVMELKESDWQTMVIVKETVPAERVPTPHDASVIHKRVGYKWSDLTKSYPDQRHRTARQIEESDNDADGWIEYERLD